LHRSLQSDMAALEEMQAAADTADEDAAALDAMTSRATGRTPGEITFILNFPNSHFSRIVGPGGSTINAVRGAGADVFIKKLGTHIEVHTVGTSEQVDAAKKMINSAVRGQVEELKPARRDDGGDRDGWGDGWGEGADWSERREPETMDFEMSAFGSIVGHSGVKIKEVRQQSGATVSIEKLNGRVEVKISGTPDQVARAKSMVTDLAAGGTLPQGAEKSETLEFERNLMGSIIGTGGKRITVVRKKTGADIQLKKEKDICQVTISGSEKQVEQAKMLVNRLAEAGRNGETLSDEEDEEDGSEDEATIQVPKEDARQIIGARGFTIKRIRTDSGATIEVDDKSEPSPIHISGTVKTVDRARAMIFDVRCGNVGDGRRGKVEFEDEEFMKISFDASKKLIGKGGCRILEIQKKSWAKVEVGKSSGEPVLVRITGSFDAVEQACSMIEESLPGVFQKKRTWADMAA